MRPEHLLLLVSCTLAPAVCRAETIIHVKATVYGCQKARAARTINNQADARQSDPGWVAYVVSDGQCVRTTTQSPWAVVGSDNDGVTLLSYRGTIGKPGSFYVPTSSIDLPTADPSVSQGQPESTDAQPVDSASGQVAAPPSIDPSPPSTASAASDAPASIAPSSTGDQAPFPSGQGGGDTTPPMQAPPEVSQPGAGAQPPTPAAIDDPQLADVKAGIAQVGATGGSTSIGPTLIIIVLLVAGGGIWFAIARSKAAERTRLMKAIKAEVASNTQALRVKRLHTVQRDEFGTVSWNKWVAAKAYYFDTRIQPIVTQAGFDRLPAGFAGAIDSIVEAAATSRPAMGSLDAEEPSFVSSPEVFDPRMHPVDYEIYCALQLQRAGWDTRTTATTGDQGADVIAKQAGKLLVVKCKLYSSPVGNDAVQQAYAAKSFQAAQFAAVVSNQPFTRSAKELASVNGVYLLHYEELQTFRPQQSDRMKYSR